MKYYSVIKTDAECLEIYQSRVLDYARELAMWEADPYRQPQDRARLQRYLKFNAQAALHYALLVMPELASQEE